jgi:hypothetical protein
MIFWPVNPSEHAMDVLLSLHPAGLQIVTYVEQGIRDNDVEGIAEFLQTHRDQDHFVYVRSRAQVAELMSGRFSGGWVEFHPSGALLSIWHTYPQKKGFRTGITFEIVWPTEETPLYTLAPAAQYRM